MVDVETPAPRRGDVVWISLNPQAGHEQGRPPAGLGALAGEIQRHCRAGANAGDSAMVSAYAAGQIVEYLRLSQR